MTVSEFLVYLATRAIVDTGNLTVFGGIEYEMVDRVRADGSVVIDDLGFPVQTPRIGDDGKPVIASYAALTDWFVPVVMMEQKGLWSPPTKFQFSVVDYGGPNETVRPKTEIVLPIGDTLIAVQYLEQQKVLGTWNAYELDNPPRSDLGFLIIKAWVGQPDVSEVVKRYRVFYDLQGNAVHAEISE